VRVAASRGTQSSIQSSPGPRRVFYSIRRSKILRSHALITHAHALQRPQQGGEKETDSAVLSAATITAQTPGVTAATLSTCLFRRWASHHRIHHPTIPFGSAADKPPA